MHFPFVIFHFSAVILGLASGRDSKCKVVAMKNEKWKMENKT